MLEIYWLTILFYNLINAISFLLQALLAFILHIIRCILRLKSFIAFHVGLTKTQEVHKGGTLCRYLYGSMQHRNYQEQFNFHGDHLKSNCAKLYRLFLHTGQECPPGYSL